ncbi:MAG: amino acid adenylation domain-containing protein [Lachnospiraceae bacterium]|nr:amino acid adenylation domain-containing protein [Lachnospiraceae bacterium]
MEIKRGNSGEELVICLSGRISGDNSDEAQRLIYGLRESEPGKRMVLDLDGLSYISSAGLRVLMKLYKEDKKLILINVSEDVYNTFDVTGFTDLFAIQKKETAQSPGAEDPINDTAWPVEFKPVSALFEEQVTKHPDRPAVVSSGLSLTYAELNDSANRIANALRYYNVRPNDTILILLPRTVMYYAVNLGILKAGAAFVTASTEYPDERIAYIFQDAECRFIITTHRIAFDRLDLIIDMGKRPLFLEDIITSPWPENPQVRIDPGDLAYCIYTSGSTGTPKGVMIEQGNLFNFLHHNPKNRETVMLAEHAEVLLANAAQTLDVSIMEEFIPLTSGLTVALASNAEILNPLLLRDFITEHKVDAMCATPSYLGTLLAAPGLKDAMKNIRVYDIGAEAFPGVLYTKIKEVNKDAVILNGYGPTETTISCTMKVIESAEEITIGVPNGNVFCYIVDKNNEEVKKGEIGELLICGKGVGRGYKNLPDQTKASFITFRGMRGYRTGDLARINEDNEIEFHGREDNQVKYHGLRIELGEIEDAMAKNPAVQTCTATVAEGRLLCVYYVLREGCSVTAEELREYAKEHLAHYMIPDLFMELQEMPMTANMKVDKKALPKPVLPKTEITAPATKPQERILAIIKDILPDTELGTTTDLRDIGLTSLELMALLAQLGDTFSTGLNMAELRANPTILDIEKLILSKPKTGGMEIKKERYPMVPLQMFMYDEMLRMNNSENVLMVLFQMDRSIDPERLCKAIRKAVRNHPILFTSLAQGDGGEAFMIPKDADDSVYEIPLFEKTEEEMPSLRGELALELADPEATPLFAFRLYRTQEKFYLFFKVPHVISDGESVEILFEDIVRAYEDKELSPEGMSMYALGDELNQLIDSPLYAQIVSYYTRLFRGMEKWTSLPEDPTGLPVGADRVAKTLTASAAQLEALYKQLKTSGNVLFMGLMALSMAIQTGGREIAVAFSHNGRSDSRVKRTFGFVINEGLLRLDADPSQSVSDYFRQVQNQVFEAMSCQAFPLMEMAEKYPGFMDYGYVYHQKPLSTTIEETEAKLHWLTITDDCPEGLIVSETAEEGLDASGACDDGLFKILTQVYEYDRIVYELTYRVNRYSRERIEAMAGDVDRMLTALICGDVTKLTVGELINGTETV